MRSPPNRKKPGSSVSDAERESSKKNVALSRAEQQRALAAKAFARRQKEIDKDIAAVKKLIASIKSEIKRRGEETQMEARFLRQVLGKIKGLKNLERQLKADQKAFGQQVETPKTYVQVVADARKLPGPSGIQTYGDLSVMLAVLLVLLNRLAALRLKKPD